MRTFWSLDIKTVLLFYEMVEKIEKDLNKTLSGTEKEIVFLELMKSENIKPAGHTELNKNEFIKELVSKNKKILNIDKDGIQIIKKKEKDSE